MSSSQPSLLPPKNLWIINNLLQIPSIHPIRFTETIRRPQVRAETVNEILAGSFATRQSKTRELIYSQSRWQAALPVRNEIRKSYLAHCDQLHFGKRIA